MKFIDGFYEVEFISSKGMESGKSWNQIYTCQYTTKARSLANPEIKYTHVNTQQRHGVWQILKSIIHISIHSKGMESGKSWNQIYTYQYTTKARSLANPEIKYTHVNTQQRHGVWQILKSIIHISIHSKGIESGKSWNQIIHMSIHSKGMESGKSWIQIIHMSIHSKGMESGKSWNQIICMSIQRHGVWQILKSKLYTCQYKGMESGKSWNQIIHMSIQRHGVWQILKSKLYTCQYKGMESGKSWNQIYTCQYTAKAWSLANPKIKLYTCQYKGMESGKSWNQIIHMSIQRHGVWQILKSNLHMSIQRHGVWQILKSNLHMSIHSKGIESGKSWNQIYTCQYTAKARSLANPEIKYTHVNTQQKHGVWQILKSNYTHVNTNVHRS